MPLPELMQRSLEARQSGATNQTGSIDRTGTRGAPHCGGDILIYNNPREGPRDAVKISYGRRHGADSRCSRADVPAPLLHRQRGHLNTDGTEAD
jgi:hypothetical protein